ncbi:hypothetical protein BD779DRAFT_224331 [Infundibulicybe gibba]|nr:hypothetical protein BD779DRAFT_224331 [Infundibulicybe gibba]
MGPNAIVPFSIIGFITAVAADVTLYQVVGPSDSPGPILSNAISVSAVGVDSGGSTTYVGPAVESFVLIPEGPGTTTKSAFSTPVTFSKTFVEDKSGWHADRTAANPSLSFSLPPVTCTFGADGKGSCEMAVEHLNSGTTSLSTSTITGSVVPFTTLRDPGPTTAPNGAGGLYSPSTLALICLSAAYLFL